MRIYVRNFEECVLTVTNKSVQMFFTNFNVFIFYKRDAEDNAVVYYSSVGWSSAYIPTYLDFINDLTIKNYERYNAIPTLEHFFHFFEIIFF